MNKNEVLTLIAEKLRDGTIVREDLKQFEGTQVTTEHASTHKITNILYIIGAIIAVIGAIILVAQNWGDIGFLGRALVSAGIAITTYVIALLMKKPGQRVLSQVLFTISAVLAPIGVYVFVREFDVAFGPWLHADTGFVLALLFAFAFWQTRRNILIIFTVAYATWSFLASISALFDVTADVAKWSSIIVGISYLCIAQYYHALRQPESRAEHREKSAVENMLYAVVTATTIIPVMSFGDVGDLLAIALIFGAFYVSVLVRSKAMLLLAALFLIIHLIKLTAEYFGDSVSWPLALIFVGFLVIAIGYCVVYISRNYFSEKPQA